MTNEARERGSGTTKSCWMDVTMPEAADALPPRSSTDVCIVGAGITGLTTAYLLARAGERVVVLESGATIGSGETARTSAHLSCALDEGFVQLEALHGAAGARMAAESHAGAIDCIEKIVRAERIECGFRRLDGFLFLGDGDRREALALEARAGRRAGLDVELMETPSGVPLAAGPCLRYPRQADFNPMQYVAGLARAIERMGGRIHTHCHVDHFEGGAPGSVRTSTGEVVTARSIVVATNTPVNNRVVIHTKQAGFRTYAMTFDVPAGVLPAVLSWDTGHPYHYVRLDRTMARAGREILIVGGEDHRTGQDPHAEARWDRLETWTRARFPQAGSVLHRWSGQVMEPMDGLAFIGRNPADAPGVYVATGDSGHGLTHGTIAALIFAQILSGREHPWTTLYDPRRRTLGALPAFARENLNTAAQYADWVRPADVASEEQIPSGEGATILTRGHRLAVYRDAQGTCHRLLAACTHLGGVVAWNRAEKSWDCPCHGARFDAMGHVVMGPAIANLAPAPAPREEQEPIRTGPPIAYPV